MDNLMNIIAPYSPLVVFISVVIGILLHFIAYGKSKGKYEERVDSNQKDIQEIKDGVQSLNKELKDDMKSLKEEIKDDMKSLNKDMKSLNKEMSNIPWKITNTIGMLLGSKELKPTPFVQSNSPMILSEGGREAARTINADTLLQAHIDALRDMVNAKCPTTATSYSVQESSKEVINEHFIKELTQEEKDGLENYVYDKSLDLDALLIIFSIKLRDILLDERAHSR